jgi:hypothetical protein
MQAAFLAIRACEVKAPDRFACRRLVRLRHASVNFEHGDTENRLLPVTYKIDTEKKLIRTKCAGNVTLQEVMDHFRSLSQDPDCPRRLDVVLDLSEAESLPDTRQIFFVISELKEIRDRVRFDACAILACRDALYGMMRVFEALAEECFRTTRTFRVAAEAEAWVAAQQSQSPADN